MKFNPNLCYEKHINKAPIEIKLLQQLKLFEYKWIQYCWLELNFYEQNEANLNCIFLKIKHCKAEVTFRLIYVTFNIHFLFFILKIKHISFHKKFYDRLQKHITSVKDYMYFIPSGWDFLDNICKKFIKFLDNKISWIFYIYHAKKKS